MAKNPVSCGADGLLGDAHDAAHGLVVHTHLIEDEEEGVKGHLLGGTKKSKTLRKLRDSLLSGVLFCFFLVWSNDFLRLDVPDGNRVRWYRRCCHLFRLMAAAMWRKEFLYTVPADYGNDPPNDKRHQEGADHALQHSIPKFRQPRLFLLGGE